MRRNLDRLLGVIAGGCALVAMAVLACVIGAIAWRGASALSWTFLTDRIRAAGSEGGILYNIVGTLILTGTALALSLPVATGIALVHSVYCPSTRSRERLGLILVILSGVPSILFGLFGLMVFVKFLGWGKSWLTGGILLGVMMLPTLAVALVERIRALPRTYLEAASGLGLNRSQIVWSVILPQCSGAWITGSLLGLARAAGETAPILFTATILTGATFPHGIKESPVLTLPYHIFVLSQDSFDPAAGANVWGAALVLLGLVFGLSLAALPARLRIHEEARHG